MFARFTGFACQIS
ncbi:hypothetical protein D020_2302A, partial [Vibrio parahaemolyticus SBR10290]